MSQNRFQPQPREKTVLDDPKLKLSADPVGGSDKRPTMSLYYAGNNPRVDVYTQVPGDADNGRIRAALDTHWLHILFVCLKRVIADRTPDKDYSISCKNYTFPNGKRSEKPEVTAKIVVARDKEHRIFLTIIASDTRRPKVRFYFDNGFWHGLADARGNPLTAADVSELVAQGWVEAYEKLYGPVAAANYVHKTAEQNGGGGGNGGGNRNGGGGGYNRGGGGGGQAPRNQMAASTGGGDDFGGDDGLPF